jgi:hypothetical protein
MLSELTEIRAHLERCSVILNNIVPRTTDEGKMIETLGRELSNTITATIKAVVATKVAKKMEIVPTQVVPAEKIVVECDAFHLLMIPHLYLHHFIRAPRYVHKQ